MGKMIAVLLATGLLASLTQKTSTYSTQKHMKLNMGIITPALQASKEFYTNLLHFTVAFENDWFIIMSSPGGEQLSFLYPGHSSQQALFQPAFEGRGIFLTVEVDDVDTFYQEIKSKGIPINIELRNEPWGDRHFAIVDPNGVGIDIVTYTTP